MSTATQTLASVASITILSIAGISRTAHADPLPGEILKFQQTPLANTPVFGTIYNGHDTPSTAYPYVSPNGTPGYQGFFAADDFADKLSTPVVHLKWWGNYMANPNNNQVTQFLISFESDIPATPNSPSMPGTPLLSQVVTLGALTPGSGTFTETPFNTTLPLRQYNAELNLGKTFPEIKDTVYWVKIVALTQDPSLIWGWHNRDYTVQDPFASAAVSPGEGNIGPAVSPIWHFQDDAVRGGVDILPNSAPGGITVNQYGMQPTNYVDLLDGPQGIGQFSQDLAFELYTSPVPEPTSIGLLAGAACAALLMRRRRRPVSQG